MKLLVRCDFLNVVHKENSKIMRSLIAQIVKNESDQEIYDFAIFMNVFIKYNHIFSLILIFIIIQNRRFSQTTNICIIIINKWNFYKLIISLINIKKFIFKSWKYIFINFIKHKKRNIYNNLYNKCKHLKKVMDVKIMY
jgi:hypothetical protein